MPGIARSLTSQALHVKTAHSGLYFGLSHCCSGILWTLSLETDLVWLQDPKCRESALPALAGGGLQGERT